MTRVLVPFIHLKYYMGILQESKYPLLVSKFLLAMPFTQIAFKVLPEDMFNDKILCATVILRNMNSQTEQYRLCCTVLFFEKRKSVRVYS